MSYVDPMRSPLVALVLAVWFVSCFESYGLTDCPVGGCQQECNQDSGGGRQWRGRGGGGTNSEYTCFYFRMYLHEIVIHNNRT